MERVLMVRVSSSDAHYAGNLVDGAYVMRLFGDALTFVSCRGDGDEGLLASYESVEFRAPVRPGDFLAISAHEATRTRLSRTVDLVATRQGRSTSRPERPSAAETWEGTADVVAVARARLVVPMAAVKESAEGH